MSRKGSVIGNRLGISKDWVSHFGNFKYGENLKKSFFIQQWLRNILERLSIWFLSMKLIQKKNLIEIHVLICYFNGFEPRVSNVFFYTFLKDNWYWTPVGIGFLKVPYSPRSSKIVTKQGKWRKYNFLINSYRKKFNNRLSTLRILEYYLEWELKFLLDSSVRIRMYNILDYYKIYETNILSNYLIILIKLYPKEQRNLYSGVKTNIFYLILGVLRKNSFLIAKTFSLGLERYKRSGKILKLYFKILREVFYVVPWKSKLGQVLRADYLKIQISGKINGQMRAVKKVYSFSHYKGKQVPVQTLNLPIDYSLTEAYTFAGVLGIKVWIG